MKIKSLLILVLSCLSLAAFAQEGGVRGNRNGQYGRGGQPDPHDRSGWR